VAGAQLTLGEQLPAVVDDGTRLTADELSARAAALAAWLSRQGVGAGDRVAFWLPSWWETFAFYAASWRLGAAAVPLHHRLTLPEAQSLVARTSPRAVFVGDALPQLAGAARVRGDRDVIRRTLDGPLALPGTVGNGTGDAAAVVLATSGSSGRPKLVVHARAALDYKAALMTRVHGLTSDDVVLMPAPLAHISGLLNGLLLPGAAGMTTVLMERWSAAAALDLIEEHRVTFMIGPPTYFVQLMGDPTFSADRVSSLRLISCGGAGVTEEFARRAAVVFGAVVKRTYGSTEAPTITTAHAGDPAERGWSTDGRATGDVELRVDDSNAELLVRGRELFTGYLDDPPPFDDDGWFATGDRARLADGWLTITGRLRDVIIRGGENVDPAEVEAVCAGLPGVGQVVVIGYPDEVMGERVGLVVVGADVTVESVRVHCAAAGLARFKTPERVLRVDDLPTLTVGKPDRAALRARFG
jgi:cyclohexanecarboxylate-CoA ligase